MPHLSDEDKENVVLSIIKHFENPEPVPSSPPKGGRRYGGRFRRHSYKENRKSSSDKENEHSSPGSAPPSENAYGQKTEEETHQVEVAKSHENGDNN